jgi:hypothetical protein
MTSSNQTPKVTNQFKRKKSALIESRREDDVTNIGIGNSANNHEIIGDLLSARRVSGHQRKVS